MCGRFSLRDPHTHPISQWFGSILSSAEQPARFNVAPSNEIVIGLATYKPSEPIQLARPQEWRILHRRVVTPFGVPSEVRILGMA